jgi:hypothetical protein
VKFQFIGNIPSTGSPEFKVKAILLFQVTVSKGSVGTGYP